MENVRKIRIELENIWIDLIRSIYAPYTIEKSEGDQIDLVGVELMFEDSGGVQETVT